MSSQPISNLTPQPIPNIKLKHSSKSTVNTQQIQDTLITNIKQNVPNFQSLKGDISILEYICNCVENMIKNGNSNSTSPIDKKQLVISIFTILFQLTPEEQTALGLSIDFLYNNNLINKITTISKASKGISSVLKKVFFH